METLGEEERGLTPERIGRASKKDKELGRSEFFVYVLETDTGYYIGHTYEINQRLKRHRSGDVPSTAKSTKLELIWKSDPFSSRKEAAEYEVVLQFYNKNRHSQFHKITGLDPKPFSYPKEYESTKVKSLNRNRIHPIVLKKVKQI